MLLHADPYQVFKNSKTPAGLYARQKWLGQGSTKSWKNDFENTVKKIQSNQLPDGSWENSIIATIDHLFSLHLTVREGNPSIHRGLDWLINLCMENFPRKRINLCWSLTSHLHKDLPYPDQKWQKMKY